MPDQPPMLGLPDPRGMIPFIRDRAQAYGIDPDIAVRVAQSEGLGNPIGDKGKSFGAFQLYTGGGMGNDFQRATGLDPADLKNEQAGIDYALKQASLHGWGPFHGAARVGISPWQGITVGSPPVGPPLAAPQPPAQQPLPAAPQQPPQQMPAQASPAGAPQAPQQQMLGLQLPPIQFPQRQLNMAPLQQFMASIHPALRGFSFSG